MGLVEQMRAYGRQHADESGGVLHIILEDGNLYDEHVRWCLVEANAEGDAAAVAICEGLLLLNDEEREQVLAQAKGRA